MTEMMRHKILEDPQQSISFYEFMNTALYHPQYGYYSKEKIKVGKEGDFYTSVSVGGVFAETLGDAIASFMDDLAAAKIPGQRGLHLIEFGGGNGVLALNLLDYWHKDYPELLETVQFVMVEKSPYHRKLQQEKLAGYPVRWFEDINQAGKELPEVTGVILSNELLDAFPVHLVEWNGSLWMEVRVGWDDAEGQFYEVLHPLNRAELLQYLAEEQVPRRKDLRAEINLDVSRWLTGVAHWLKHGYVLTIDYGWLREELYRPERRRGTLMCYRGHTANDNPYEHVGDQDITSHVNFSFLIQRGEELGLKKLEYSTQSQFLIQHGIFHKLQEHSDPDPFRSEAAKRNRAIRQLALPGGMGEVFKVLVQKKDK